MNKQIIEYTLFLIASISVFWLCVFPLFSQIDMIRSVNEKPDGTLVKDLQSEEFNYTEDVVKEFNLDSNLNRKAKTVKIYRDGIEIKVMFNCDSVVI